MEKISIWGILVGAAARFVALFVLSAPLIGYGIYKYGAGDMSSLKVQHDMVAAMSHDPLFYWTQVAIGFACAVFGGFVAGRVAKRDVGLNGALACVVGMAVTFAFVLSGNSLSSTNGDLVLAAISPAFGFLGGKLAAMRAARRVVRV